MLRAGSPARPSPRQSARPPATLSPAPPPLLPAQTQFIHEEKVALPVGAVIGAVTGFLTERLREDGGKAGGGAGGEGGDDDGDAAGADGLGGFGSETAAQQAVAAAAAGRRLDDSIEREADSSTDSTVMFDPFRENAQGLTGRRV